MKSKIKMKTSNRIMSGGFTLIELLVVISIIAVLMAIMMPALSKVRQNAKKTLCGTNLHQISLALFCYATDNDGKFWEGIPEFEVQSDPKRGQPTLISIYSMTEVMNYGYDTEVWWCPTDIGSAHYKYYYPITQASIEDWADDGNFNMSDGNSYSNQRFGLLPSSYTFWNVWGLDSKLRTESVGKTTSEQVIVQDNVKSRPDDCFDNVNHWDKDNNRDNLYPRPPQYGEPQGGNVVLGDGHVTWRKFEDMKMQYELDGVGKYYY
ncbi:MAG: type II secretion system protein [Sedimentisphaeraceae bacterium JB056]